MTQLQHDMPQSLACITSDNYAIWPSVAAAPPSPALTHSPSRRPGLAPAAVIALAAVLALA